MSQFIHRSPPSGLPLIAAVPALSLVWSVIACLLTMFPILYIPVISDYVFQHVGIGWEWGLVAGSSSLFS